MLYLLTLRLQKLIAVMAVCGNLVLMGKKIKVARILTAPEVVKFHLKNFLKFSPRDFDIVVIGTNVKQYENIYPHIKWIDHTIPRKIALLKDFKALIGLIRILQREKPDIVHSIMPKSGLLAALASFLLAVPVRLHTFTGQVWATKSNPMRFLLKSLDAVIIRLNTMCLTDSPSQSQFLFENDLRSDNKPLPFLGHGSLDGIDLSIFDISKLKDRARDLREKHGVPESGFVFLFLGRKNLDKGVDILITAYKQLIQKYSDCYLFYIGPSESDDFLRNNPTLDIQNMITVGYTDEPEVYIAASNVFCLPSLREGFGNTVIECAALGVPTIGSRISGLVDSIQENKSGLLFTVGSADELFNQMLRLYLDRKLLKSLSENGVWLVRDQYSAQTMRDLTYKMYKQLLNQN